MALDENPLLPAFEPIYNTLHLVAETMAKNDARILELMEQIAARIVGHDADIADLREGLAALSNRIEALTQAGLHSVKVPQ